MALLWMGKGPEPGSIVVAENRTPGKRRFQLSPEVRIAPAGRSAKMSAVPDTIEAEVLEIDGSPPLPPARAPEPAKRGRDQAWQAMLGRVLQLDRRWWPLWVLLGIVALILFAVVACFVAVFVVVAKLLGTILRFLTGSASARPGSTLSRRPF